MLVVISDLHFSDGTATEQHVDPRAFRLLLSEIYHRAGTCQPCASGQRELDIVLLGDVFDLLRTERWFEERGGAAVPLSQRPWGAVEALGGAAPGPATLAHARAITEEIIEKNAAALALLRGEGLEPLLPPGTRLRRLFLPGNHDRLFLHDAAVRERVLAALGAHWGGAPGAGAELAGEGVLPHRLEMHRYGLLARHGHEWDPWNYEATPGASLPPIGARARPPAFADEDYRNAPIGDAITTELVARLPYELHRRLREHPAFSGSEELLHVYRRLQLVEDVRPLLSSFHWVFYEADHLGGQLAEAQGLALGEALSDTLFTLADEFLQLDFYRAWRERHDHLGLDRSDSLHLLLQAVRQLPRLDLRGVGRALAVADPLLRRLAELGEDRCLAGAGQEELSALGSRGLRFVVFGHTHEPQQTALRRGAAADLYLNSGTFRDRQYATYDGHGFVGWQHFSYLVFYEEGELPAASSEDRRRGPAYERWMGTRGRGA